ncbi:MarR family winged helix-turn-helix transcriptional regulator [uncultured Sulfitobacter sp.]|uniref:MarR family winged helix-turn-helix transcriptional regulator n=1 Tax=uncultured Sulfitobacter sp. TaxID=191468 RepID=UPI0026045E55|nr:MarR family winged helix-turn-helix transcriptional regulator [uncultured Sulfitobacter sp.]
MTEPHLTFLASLDCGATQASAVAQRLGVTRQAIYRTTTEMQNEGFPPLEPDPVRRNQKSIVITPKGMILATNAPQALGKAETEFAKRAGFDNLDELRGILNLNLGDPIKT